VDREVKGIGEGNIEKKLVMVNKSNSERTNLHVISH